jgi:hypothetical protein
MSWLAVAGFGLACLAAAMAATAFEVGRWDVLRPTSGGAVFGLAARMGVVSLGVLGAAKLVLRSAHGRLRGTALADAG